MKRKLLSLFLLSQSLWGVSHNEPNNHHADSLLPVWEKELPSVQVRATRIFQRNVKTPVIVNMLSSDNLEHLQTCNLSESLKFQPGLRMETNCQTCNYTQLRMNGLPGGYSQILINGRPIFSPLVGLYGLEQLPTGMIERIEVVRGGGSSLYGSSAIGGTVNVITKIPSRNAMEVNSFYQYIDGQTSDFNLLANASLVNRKNNMGASVFLNKRNRGFYDANGDGFSEIPKLENTSFGVNSFFKFDENQKLELSVSHLNEYRFGGEMTDKPAYLSAQNEERTHKLWMGNVDYQINFNDDQTSLITYAAFQNALRDHYTGALPDDSLELADHLINPPYGHSKNTTVQVGTQLHHALSDFWVGRNVLTFGSEYIYDKVNDKIDSYNYLVNQRTRNWGTFVNSDWQINGQINLFAGVRVDKHNLLKNWVVNPRVALLYTLPIGMQMRASYGTGFRAPQAFDTDLHMTFAGGGVSRVVLSPTLKKESSRTSSISINYDYPTEMWIAGFTLEGFYTHLKDPFVIQESGKDAHGNIFEKRNGDAATVKGITAELRANFARKIQIESGLTIQSAKYDTPQEYLENVAPMREFLRTPSVYGFVNINITPSQKWYVNLNQVYTGSMKVQHMAGAGSIPQDEIVSTRRFAEVNAKIGYNLFIPQFGTTIELYGGMKNIFNAYQTDFDKGKDRDSDYIYGPAMPRTCFIGAKWSF